MKFSTNFEDILFEIELEKDASYSEPASSILDREDKAHLSKGEVAYYQLTISPKTGDELGSYYIGGILFTTDEKDLLIELEDYLFEYDVFEDIIEKLGLAPKDQA